MKNSLFYFRNLSLVVLLFLACFQPGLIIAAELNLAPACSSASASPVTLWPVNHKFTGITITGVTDPDGDPLSIAIQCILQDEELNATGDGNFIYDADGIDTPTPSVRSERSGNNNGRVYHIDFIATDSKGARCGGEVTVAVPHSKNTRAVDDGRLYKSVPSDNPCGQHDINNPPWIYSDPVLSGATYAEYRYDVDGHDPDRDTLTYSIISGPTGLEIDPGGGLLAWSVPEAGIFSVTVGIDDGRGGSDTQSFELFINGPPTISSEPILLHQAGSAYQYQVLAIDPNNDTLIYELQDGPQGMVIDPATGLVFWEVSLPGEYPVSLQVTDGRGGSDTQSYTLFINGPPEITSVPTSDHQTGAPYSYQVVATDPNHDPLTYQLVAAPQAMTIDPATGLANWPEPEPGGFSITIRVADGHGGSDEQGYVLRVNGPPVITSTPVTEQQAGAPYRYQVLADDPNHDPLTFDLTEAPAGMIIDPATGLISWDEPAAGEYTVTILVGDGRGGTVTQTFSLFINGPPEITGSPTTEHLATTLYQYQIIATDPNNDALAFSLTQATAGMSVSGSGLVTWTPTMDQLGSHEVSVQVSDGRGGMASQSWSIEVLSPNSPPTITNTPPPRAAVGVLYQYPVLTLDPDRDPLAHSLPEHPAGMVIDPVTGIISWTPTEEQLGMFSLTIQVDDGHGETDTQTAQIEVIPDSVIDLEPLSLDLSATAVDPQSLILSGTAQLTVRNNGVGYFEAGYEVVLFEDTDRDNTYSEADSVLGWHTVAQLHNGGDNLDLAIELDTQVAFRDNLVHAFVDSGRRVTESDESNNHIHNQVGCTYVPEVGGFDPEIEWEWNGSEVMNSYKQVMSIPVVANLNDDNGDGRIDTNDIPDIVFQTFSGGSYTGLGVLRAISGDGSGELFSVTAPLVYAVTNPAVGDIDNDGIAEIITFGVVSGKIHLLAFEHDGTLKWTSQSPLSGTYYTLYVSIADLNGDGQPELIAGKTVFNNDGTLKWVGSGTYHPSVVADLDLDGRPEVIAGNSAFDSEGHLLWQNLQVSAGHRFPAVGNFDEDPYPEIVVVSSGRVFLLEHNGVMKWGPITLPGGGNGGPPTIADYDSDGEPEIGVAGASKYVVFETDGSIKWEQSVRDRSSNITGSSVFDFEGDGSAEVVYADEVYLHIFRGTDGQILYKVNTGSGTLIEYPLIVDVDNDNNAEIVLGTNNYYVGPKTGIMVFGDANDTWVNTRKIWNQHAYSITNVNDDGTIPRVAANNWESFNNFRQNEMLNPFGCEEVTASRLAVDQANSPASVELSATIGNGGLLDLAPGTPVSFYQGDPESSGTLLGTVTVTERLQPGQSTEVSLAWSNPAMGLTQIVVRADDDGTGRGRISEKNETNNRVATWFNLGNKAPAASAGADLQVIAGTSVQLDGSASTDPENDPLTFAWTLTNKPEGSQAELLDADSATPSFTPDLPGAYLVQLVVSDDYQDSGVAFVRIDALQLVQVPDVLGLARSEAEATLTAADLIPGELSYQASSIVPAGHVMDQTPAAGTEVMSGSAVDCTISTGLNMKVVPGLVGLTLAGAESLLAESGLSPGQVVENYTNLQPEGKIFQQSPEPGSLLPEGDSVNLNVSLGPWSGTDTEPPKVGLTISPSRVNPGEPVTITVRASDNVGIVNQTLTVNGLGLAIDANNQAVYIAETPGQVAAVFKAYDAAGSYGTVTASFIVNDPARTTIVPDVVGQFKADGQAALQAAELLVSTTTYTYNEAPRDTIISQSVAPGAEVTVGTPVNLIVSYGPRLVPVPDLTGMTRAEAEATLTATYLTVGQTGEQYSGLQPAGKILAQDPVPGTMVSSDSPVSLTLSLGPWTGVDETPPLVTLNAEPATVPFGAPVTLSLFADDNVGIATASLQVDGEVLTVSGPQVLYIPTGPGVKTAILTATDLAGNMSSASAGFVVTDPYDLTAPEVSLGLGDCPELTLPTPITGTISDANEVSYQLNIRPEGASAWSLLADGEGNTQGDLATLDPTLLRNGVYQVELSAVDISGNLSFVRGCVVADGGIKLGQVNLAATDLEVQEQGFPLALERAYDSRNTSGDFGPGWSLASKEITAQPTRELAGGWGQMQGGGTFATYYLIEKYRHQLVVRLPDDQLLKFRMDVNPKSSMVYPIEGQMPLTVSWLPDALTGATLEPLNAETILRLTGSYLREYADDLYRPTRFRITLPEGTRYVVSMSRGLESMTDVYGHTITYGTGSISHSSGASISFQRDTENRINRVTGPQGQEIVYHYDENGMLQKVMQEGPEPPYTRTLAMLSSEFRTTFGKPSLRQIMAPDGTVLGSIEYVDGRMTALIDADGNKMIYGYDINNLSQAITDRNGNTTDYTFDVKGNVTSKTDPLGNVARWSYDVNNNKLSETDPLGNTTSFTYDSKNNLISETDPLGAVTSYTYNSKRKVTSTTDPLGHVTTNNYDTYGNLYRSTDAVGNITNHDYDADGNLESITDALGNTTAYTYDTKGNRVAEIDPLGTTTRYTFDGRGNELSRTVTQTTANGVESFTTTMEYDIKNRLTRTVYPDGTESLIEYNLLDKKSAEKDRNGQRTEYEYDNNGNLTLTRFADGTTVGNTYDPEGNRISATDQLGRTTYYQYDELKRLVITTFPDNTVAENVYDATGQLIQTIDQRGHATTYEYDEAGRRTAVIDALDHRTEYEYDPAGNQAAFTDAKGYRTEYVYDALNRQVAVIHPDGTTSRTEYDALNRKSANIDQNGRITRFAYDKAGRLLSVTDAPGGVTAYTYDEQGNKLSQTDAMGRITSWTYDVEGRVLSRTLPLGQRESFTYDPLGNVLSHTDFNGDTTTFAYTPCCGKIAQKTFPDGSTEDYTYTATGQVETVTGANGATHYIYDERDRLTRMDNPDGTFISYGYDDAGNRITVTIPSGTTRYTFDTLNRLATVTDPDGGITTYTYDQVGNRQSETLPGNTTTSYVYNSLNRLTSLETRAGGNTLLASYAYTLDLAGNRTRVMEHTGRTVGYTYDLLYRLTGEEIRESDLSTTAIGYTYDRVGNRLSKTLDGIEVASYAYDANDRLLSDGTATYSYDHNGNLLNKLGPASALDYTFDAQNRLVRLETPTNTLEYAYNHEGIRIAKWVDGTETGYLIDPNQPYAQVLEEYAGDQLTTSYVYGTDLLSRDDGTRANYLYDGQLSTRKLVNTAGQITDTYDYDAFGELLNTTDTTPNNYLYTGEQYDLEAGMYYLRARYYDQASGRFLGMDPYAGNMQEPATLHRYLYTGANPVMNVDPGGEFFSLGSLTTSLGIMSTIGSIATSSYAGVLSKVKANKIEITLSANKLKMLSPSGITLFNATIAHGCSGSGGKYKTPTGKYKTGEWIKDKTNPKYGPIPWSKNHWANPYGPWFLKIMTKGGSYTALGIHGTRGPGWYWSPTPFIPRSIMNRIDQEYEFLYCSHGCIRTSNYHIQKLQKLIPNTTGNQSLDIEIKD